MGVIDAVDDLILQPFLDVCTDGAQARNPVDDIDRQVEAIDLIVNGKLQRCVDVALFLVAADVDVLVVVATIA